MGYTELIPSQWDIRCFLHDEKSGLERVYLLTNKLCFGLCVDLDKTEAIWMGTC